MKLKQKILLKLMGDEIPEAYFIDSFLGAFKDCLPHTELTGSTGDIGWIESRVVELLIERKFLKNFDTGFIITSAGIIHLEKGGFVGEHIRHKTSVFSFWLSMLATVASLSAIIISVFR